MQVHIPSFAPARILIVGDVMLDRYWYGPSTRISPEAPVPVVRVEQIEERLAGLRPVQPRVGTLLLQQLRVLRLFVAGQRGGQEGHAPSVATALG